MISSYNSATQDVLTDGLLAFSTNRILTGCTVTHNENSTTFRLNKPGYYYVSFNGTAATAETAGVITVELQNNGVSVPGAEASSYSAAATNIVNLAFSTIVKVPPGCGCVDNSVALTFLNAGVEANYENVNVNITKLCQEGIV